jgi:hypothetical protein
MSDLPSIEERPSSSATPKSFIGRTTSSFNKGSLRSIRENKESHDLSPPEPLDKKVKMRSVRKIVTKVKNYYNNLIQRKQCLTTYHPILMMVLLSLDTILI